MFTVNRPSLNAIDRFLKRSEQTSLSYSPIGLAMQSPAGFDIGEHVISIGHGRATFHRAEAALCAWKQFDLGWIELFPKTAPIEPGIVVAVLVRHLRFWSLNGCRILYLLGERGEGTSFGFAYGTLTNHGERGEETFEVHRQPESGDVTYRIRAVAQPRVLAAWLGRPILRVLQERFRRDSGEALRRAVGASAIHVVD